MARSEEVPQEVPSLPTGSTSISDTYQPHNGHISSAYIDAHIGTYIEVCWQDVLTSFE